MQTAKAGDRVQVHYVKRLRDGAVASSRRRAPLEVIVGVNHPLLPGLGSALVGLSPGQVARVRVAPGEAYGHSDPARVKVWPRERFPDDRSLEAGKWVSVLDRKGRRRSVRIVQVRGRSVVVDTNHRGTGQYLDLAVELISIQTGSTTATL